MTEDFPDRPEHIPRGYEWLPDAYKRDVEPHGSGALERVRYALGEGDIVARLLYDLGQFEPIDQRAWRKTPIAEKVLPRFQDGRMTLGMPTYEGPRYSGWVFVPEGALARYLSQPKLPSRRSKRVTDVMVESWYKEYVCECQGSGHLPSEAQDLMEARAVFDEEIPRQRIRDLRKRLAPAAWKKPGRRPTKSRQN